MVDSFLFKTAVRDALRAKRVAVACLLIVAPACIALILRVAMRREFDGVATYGALSSLLVFGFVLPILAVVFGSGAILQELEQKTIVYLLTRPVPRWRILLWKFVAGVLSIIVTVWLATLLLAAVTYTPGAADGSARLHPGSLLNARALCEHLQTPQDSVSLYLQTQLSARTLQRLNEWDPETAPRPRLVQAIVNDLNRVISRDRSFYDAERFTGLHVPEDARQLVAERPTGERLARLNRMLLEAAYPGLLARSRSTMAQLPRDLLVLPVGALAYGAAFLLLGTLFQRALVIGLFLAFGWESWVPMLPGNFKLVSIMTYLRALAPHARPERATVDITSLFDVLNPEMVSTSLAWIVLSSATTCFVLMALLVFSVKEYVPKDDAL